MKHEPLKPQGSLLERAAEIYDFGSGLRVPAPDLPPRPTAKPLPVVEPQPVPEPEVQPVRVEAAPQRVAPSPVQPSDWFDEPAPAPAPARKPIPVYKEAIQQSPVAKIDRARLRAAGHIMPDAPSTGLAEEFRLIKRQLVGKAGDADDKHRCVLIASAQAGEGKTFSALNLALSLASERDVEVLLVDADFSKPEILSQLGIEGGRGFVDALIDPVADPEEFVIRTDVRGLSVLPAGQAANNIPELIASERTREVMDRLMARPRRIVIFDSPPVLAASPATILAALVGQVVLVVRADRTTEADLREAAGLLSGCDELRLLLNGAGFAATARRFGSYDGNSQ